MMLHDCIACQYGMHDEHVRVTQPVSEDVLGGAMCPCKGDCAERNAERIAAENQRITGVPPADNAALEWLEDFLLEGKPSGMTPHSEG
jgi:hypothetical protein